MKTLYIDCAMGCAGDMLTAALLELHPDREGFIRRMNAVLNGKAVVSAVADKKCGIVGTHVSVLINGEEEGAATCTDMSMMSTSIIMNTTMNISIPITTTPAFRRSGRLSTPLTSRKR